MQSLELKKQIHAYVDEADTRLLRIVKGFFENYYDENEEVVAFHPDGSPMTKREYKIALDVAEAQIQDGDFISAEEFEQQESE